MQLATASVPSTDWHAAYLDHLALTGRGNTSYSQAARSFFRRWPDPQVWAQESLEAGGGSLELLEPSPPVLLLLHDAAVAQDEARP